MIWKIIANAKMYMDKCRKDNISAFAAQSAFFIIISLIPFIMVFCSLLQYTPVTESMVTELVNGLMPQYVAVFMIPIIDEVYNKSVGIISITAIIAIWSAAKGVQYMAAGLNMINGIEETRNWVVLRFWAIIHTVVFILSVAGVLVLLVFGNSIQELLAIHVPLMAHAVELFFKLRGVIVMGGLICLFTVLYKTLPNNKGLKEINRKLTYQNQFPGALLCGVAWYLFSFGLSVYVDYFNGFSMYGNLTTIVLMMLWLYFCMYIMMMCAEVNVMFEDTIRERFEKKRG